MGYVISKVLRDGICKDCTVIAGKTDLTFENGTRADIGAGVGAWLNIVSVHL